MNETEAKLKEELEKKFDEYLGALNGKFMDIEDTVNKMKDKY